ncbi:MAG: ATP-binding protein [Burkholderiales bacterium]|nr:ATP-binding protein [Burkholderiales bacterium]
MGVEKLPGVDPRVVECGPLPTGAAGIRGRLPMQRTVEGNFLAEPPTGEPASTFSWSALLGELASGLQRLSEAARADLEALETAFPERTEQILPRGGIPQVGLTELAEKHRALRQERLQPALRSLERVPPGRRIWLTLERMTRTLERAVERIPEQLPRTNSCLEGLPGGPIRERSKARPLAARNVARFQVAVILERLDRQAREVVVRLDLRALKGLQDWRRDCLAQDRALLPPLMVRAARRSMRAQSPRDPLKGLLRLIHELEERFPAGLRRALLANRTGHAPSKASRQRLRDAMEVAATEVALEAHIERLWDGLEGLLAGLLAVEEREDTACRREVRELTEVLQMAAEHGVDQDLTVPVSLLTGSVRHLENLTRKVTAFAQKAPEDLVRATAGRRPLPFRSAPTRVFLRAFEVGARPRLKEALENLEARLEELSCESQRARELLEYSRDSEDFQQEVGLAREALQAQALNLERQEASLPPVRSFLSPLAARLLTEVIWEVRLVLDRCPRMAADFRLRLGANRLNDRLEALAQTTAQAGLRRSWQFLKNESQLTLVRLGWIPAATENRPQVELRPAMPGDEVSTLARMELPVTYRRLFRPLPVNDPRFLVGRNLELEAIGAARASWEAGRPTAVMIRGARGSGKTSLLNCAAKGVLEGLPVVRMQPPTRIYSEDGLQEWLQTQPLEGTRQVIILEEAERLYLRRIGGFQAIKGLLQTIQRTQPEALWIVVLNLYAARLLNAACGFETNFTHRLHAETVGPAELREAIMVRHRLSGLRLRFLDGTTDQSTRLRWSGGANSSDDPESHFFSTLHKHSGGVFRSALEIWLDSIEPAERGTLTVKPLAQSIRTDAVEDLPLEIYYTLVAVLQHGSLTPAEHAEVFDLSLPASQAHLLDLVGRRLLEDDPDHPGFRVRPEARSPVRQVLYRLNLL